MPGRPLGRPEDDVAFLLERREKACRTKPAKATSASGKKVPLFDLEGTKHQREQSELRENDEEIPDAYSCLLDDPVNPSLANFSGPERRVP